MKLVRKLFVFCRFAIVIAATTFPSADLYASSGKDYEEAIVKITSHLRNGNFETAQSIAKNLHNGKSATRLASLLYADILAAQAGPLSSVGGLASEDKELRNLKHELNVRWDRHAQNKALLKEKVPASLIQLSNSTEHVIYADLSTSRLYIYQNRNGVPHLINDYYVTQGLKGALKQVEGDQRTPVGVYYITGFISGATLPSRYGPGALPINYPNALDIELSRTGYGIWIHGTEPYLVNRSPYASDGCLSLNNNDFKHFNRLIQRKRFTPVVIEMAIDWVDFGAKDQAKIQLTNIIQKWAETLSQADDEKLAVFYKDSSKFFDESITTILIGNETTTPETERTIEIVDLELFQYPGEPGLYVAEFEHNNIYETQLRRVQQYWKKDSSGNWKIQIESISPKNSMIKLVTETKSSNKKPSS